MSAAMMSRLTLRVDLSMPLDQVRNPDKENRVVRALLSSGMITPNQQTLAEATWLYADQNLTTASPVVAQTDHFNISLLFNSRVNAIVATTQRVSKVIDVELVIQRLDVLPSEKSIIDLINDSNLSPRQKMVAVVIAGFDPKTFLIFPPFDLTFRENRVTVSIWHTGDDYDNLSLFQKILRLPEGVAFSPFFQMLSNMNKAQQTQLALLEAESQAAISNLRKQSEAQPNGKEELEKSIVVKQSDL